MERELFLRAHSSQQQQSARLQKCLSYIVYRVHKKKRTRENDAWLRTQKERVPSRTLCSR